MSGSSADDPMELDPPQGGVVNGRAGPLDNSEAPELSADNSGTGKESEEMSDEDNEEDDPSITECILRDSELRELDEFDNFNDLAEEYMDLALRHKDLKEKFRNSKELYQVNQEKSNERIKKLNGRNKRLEERLKSKGKKEPAPVVTWDERLEKLLQTRSERGQDDGDEDEQGSDPDYENIYRACCKQENMSQVLGTIHPELQISRREFRAAGLVQIHEIQQQVINHYDQQSTDTLPPGIAPPPDRSKFHSLPIEIQGQIFKYIWVKPGPIHCLSRLDPVNVPLKPEYFPAANSGATGLPHRFFFGSGKCSIMTAYLPSQILAPLLVSKRWFHIGVTAFYGMNTFAFSSFGEFGRFMKGIGTRRQRVAHVELHWQGSIMQPHKSKVNQRTLPLVYLTELNSLKTLLIFINEAEGGRTRRLYENKKSHRLKNRQKRNMVHDDYADRSEDESDLEVTQNDIETGRGPRGYDINKLEPWGKMMKRTARQPNFRGNRSMRTCHGMDYVYQLRGMGWVRFREVQEGRKKKIRDWSFAKDISKVVTMQKSSQFAWESRFENLEPLAGARGYILSDQDLELLNSFYGSGDLNFGPIGDPNPIADMFKTDSSDDSDDDSSDDSDDDSSDDSDDDSSDDSDDDSSDDSGDDLSDSGDDSSSDDAPENNREPSDIPTLPDESSGNGRNRAPSDIPTLPDESSGNGRNRAPSDTPTLTDESSDNGRNRAPSDLPRLPDERGNSSNGTEGDSTGEGEDAPMKNRDPLDIPRLPDEGSDNERNRSPSDIPTLPDERSRSSSSGSDTNMRIDNNPLTDMGMDIDTQQCKQESGDDSVSVASSGLFVRNGTAVASPRPNPVPPSPNPLHPSMLPPPPPRSRLNHSEAPSSSSSLSSSSNQASGQGEVIDLTMDSDTEPETHGQRPTAGGKTVGGRSVSFRQLAGKTMAGKTIPGIVIPVRESSSSGSSIAKSEPSSNGSSGGIRGRSGSAAINLSNVGGGSLGAPYSSTAPTSVSTGRSLFGSFPRGGPNQMSFPAIDRFVNNWLSTNTTGGSSIATTRSNNRRAIFLEDSDESENGQGPSAAGPSATGSSAATTGTGIQPVAPRPSPKRASDQISQGGNNRHRQAGSEPPGKRPRHDSDQMSLRVRSAPI